MLQSMMKKMEELERKIEDVKRERKTTEHGSSDYENWQGTSYNRGYRRNQGYFQYSGYGRNRVDYGQGREEVQIEGPTTIHSTNLWKTYQIAKVNTRVR
ncbi:hypothetical protein DPMN_157854 [Dreissena polymorpha]|uniref:Uncharacterized protein n=1 Tax=Dreissena polymorpha TaxID=45954 RepID=A0A9D4EIT8_DREPO|nr:hypothetical protein DPMN_157854 [Dreissena polymorpha]